MRHEPTPPQNSMFSQLWQSLISVLPFQSFKNDYVHKNDDDAKAIVAVKGIPLNKDYVARIRELGGGLAPMMMMFLVLALLHQAIASNNIPNEWGGGYFYTPKSFRKFFYSYRFQRIGWNSPSELLWDEMLNGDHGIQVVGDESIRGLVFKQLANVTCSILGGNLSSFLIQANHTAVNDTDAVRVLKEMANIQGGCPVVDDTWLFIGIPMGLIALFFHCCWCGTNYQDVL